MKEFKPPQLVSGEGPFLFLAGSIEMGTAEEWQQKAVELLANTHWSILNPRRDDWDSSLTQDIDDPVFNEQVNWELSGIERCDKALVYLSPTTRSPITLLELGILSQIKKSEDILVICPEGFYRKGNVDIVCKRYGIEQYPDIESACAALGGVLK